MCRADIRPKLLHINVIPQYLAILSHVFLPLLHITSLLHQRSPNIPNSSFREWQPYHHTWVWS